MLLDTTGGYLSPRTVCEELDVTRGKCAPGSTGASCQWSISSVSNASQWKSTGHFCAGRSAIQSPIDCNLRSHQPKGEPPWQAAQLSEEGVLLRNAQHNTII